LLKFGGWNNKDKKSPNAGEFHGDLPMVESVKKNNFHEGRLLEFQFLQIHRFHLSTAGMRFTTGRVEIPIDIQELHLPRFVF